MNFVYNLKLDPALFMYTQKRYKIVPLDTHSLIFGWLLSLVGEIRVLKNFKARNKSLGVILKLNTVKSRVKEHHFGSKISKNFQNR